MRTATAASGLASPRRPRRAAGRLRIRAPLHRSVTPRLRTRSHLGEEIETLRGFGSADLRSGLVEGAAAAVPRLLRLVNRSRGAAPQAGLGSNIRKQASLGQAVFLAGNNRQWFGSHSYGDDAAVVIRIHRGFIGHSLAWLVWEPLHLRVRPALALLPGGNSTSPSVLLIALSVRIPEPQANLS